MHPTDTMAVGKKVLLMSVGTAIEPLVKSLQEKKPSLVWFFCSKTTKDQLKRLVDQLDWNLEYDWIDVSDYENLNVCYQKLRRCIPSLLSKWEITPDQVVVDYTGGVKPMSAALVLAGVDFFQNFCYVGGKKRDEQQGGRVISGEEKVIDLSNPWDVLAIREVERVKDLWRVYHWEECAEILKIASTKVCHQKKFFLTMSDLSRGLAERHRLDFREAVKTLRKALHDLELLVDDRCDMNSILNWLKQSVEICGRLSGVSSGQLLLDEILDNVLRTKRQGRYEDAAARLYRAMELQGQIWLQEKTDGCFVLGKCKDPNLIPEALRDWEACCEPKNQEIALSLNQIYTALAKLGHESGMKIVADLDQKKTSRWILCTTKRNHSVLAHGSVAVGKEGFIEMEALASEFLGFDLTREKMPVPEFKIEWFYPVQINE